jgi:glycosyltransferase involved in cell wall biosynthesis
MMDNIPKLFENVSLLITHYNRSNSLERLLRTFRELNISFHEIIVSDDSSKPEHLEHIKALENEYVFRLVGTEKNKGLGNNINKGQVVVKSPYTLYVQEDFVPLHDFALHFDDALRFMEEDQKLDIVRLYAYSAYPNLKPYKKGFSELIYKPWHLDKNKVYFYSDHPHLRRSTFFDKFGQYQEGLKVDRTEYAMCAAFIQNKGAGLFFDKYSTLFRQENSAVEPSTVVRDNWKQSNNLFISSLRWMYRQIKYNYDLNFSKKYKR